MSSFKYVSCFKFGGVPILPPLISEKDREILRLYKEKAIQKEKELARNKISKQTIQLIDDSDYGPMSDNNSDSDISDHSLETAKVLDFIREALFDVGPSDIKLLQSKILKEMENFKFPFKSASCDTLHLVEDISMSDDKEPFNHNLESPSCHIKESFSEYQKESLSEQVNQVTDEEDFQHGISNQLSDSLSQDHIDDCVIQSPQNSEDIENTNVQTPPKLIRSNSYTLESPSPSVLLYLKSLPRYHSEGSPSEITTENKVIKNLNNFWFSSENEGQKNDVGCLLSGSNSSSFPPSGNCDNHEVPENIISDKNFNLLEDISITEHIKNVSIEKNKPSLTIRKKHLSPAELVMTAKKEKAIIKIQAGIRGYLTRRLMKTYKVMELRNTIKDSLICALALHSEQNVSSADVNLHVRLIRQVTAACYELHAIFFEYTIPQKMHLISFDREKLLSAEKAKVNLEKLKDIKSDEETQKNGVKKSSNRGKVKRPSSLLLSRKSPVVKPWS